MKYLFPVVFSLGSMFVLHSSANAADYGQCEYLNAGTSKICCAFYEQYNWYKGSEVEKWCLGKSTGDYRITNFSKIIENLPDDPDKPGIPNNPDDPDKPGTPPDDNGNPAKGNPGNGKPVGNAGENPNGGTDTDFSPDPGTKGQSDGDKSNNGGGNSNNNSGGNSGGNGGGKNK